MAETMLDVKKISRAELKSKMERGEEFKLVETLAETSYRQSHLPGAINLPPDRIRELAPVLLPDSRAG